jgi:YidC/Oxa1 family membrane protein insertase
LVVATTWAQQKLLTPPNPDPQSASMNQSMQIMMPLMFGFFALSFSSALSIYFIISNVVGVGQYAVINRWFRGNWEQESQPRRTKPAKQPSATPAESDEKDQRQTPRRRRKKKRVRKK